MRVVTVDELHGWAMVVPFVLAFVTYRVLELGWRGCAFTAVLAGVAAAMLVSEIDGIVVRIDQLMVALP